ncbi:sugar transferase [Patescibacteria group bacterium]|nr:sugar transferase [Patescibacteria group bacterium]
MEFTRRETAILALGDFLILIASLWVALAIRNFGFPQISYFESNLTPFIPVFLLSIVVFYIAGLYEKQTRLVKLEMGERILGAQVANVILAALLFFVLPLSIAPKTILALYFAVSVIAVSAWRLYRAKRERSAGAKTRALLVASGTAAREVFEEVNGNDRYLFSFTAHIDPAGKRPEELERLVNGACRAGVTAVVIDTRDAAVAPILPALYGALLGGTAFLEFAAFYENVFDRVPLDHIDHAWLLERLPRRHRTLYGAAKRIFDILFGIIVLIIASPFIALAAVLLRLSGGPAFIKNERVGQDGRTFNLIKLRTMLINDHGDPKLRAANRVTKLGAFLRKTRIDELPQLINVIAGDLAFIGPRPELPSIAAVYEREIPYYHVRHVIPPGLSGWAQIHDYDAPRGGADAVRTRRKLSFDLYYLKHRSFLLDLAVTLKTLRALFSLSGT